VLAGLDARDADAIGYGDHGRNLFDRVVGEFAHLCRPRTTEYSTSLGRAAKVGVGRVRRHGGHGAACEALPVWCAVALLIILGGGNGEREGDSGHEELDHHNPYLGNHFRSGTARPGLKREPEPHAVRNRPFEHGRSFLRVGAQCVA
jgi:hypothetical protein